MKNLKEAKRILDNQIVWLDATFCTIKKEMPKLIAVDRAMGLLEATIMVCWAFHADEDKDFNEEMFNDFYADVNKRAYELYYEYFGDILKGENWTIFEEDFMIIEKE